jgi:hypothetical protein
MQAWKEHPPLLNTNSSRNKRIFPNKKQSPEIPGFCFYEYFIQAIIALTPEFWTFLKLAAPKIYFIGYPQKKY